MLDIQFIRENAEQLKKVAKDKNIDMDIDALIKADEERRKLLHEVEELRAEKNKASENIAKLDGKEKESAIGAMKKVDEKQQKLEKKLQTALEKYNKLMLLIPNVVHKDTPAGKDEGDNKELKKWGEVPKFDFEPLDHVTLGEKLDIIDIPRGVKTSGSRFYYLKNEGALLELALLRFTLDKLMEKGFTPFAPPLLVKYEAMMGTSYFPGGEEQAYAVGVERENSDIEPDNLYMIGTSEVPVASYHSDELLEEGDLPKKYAGISQCFRREAGTYGKDTHGLYRIHQFQKVEQVILCKNDPKESEKMHKEILENAEEVLQALGLPYRVVAVCTGDMGQGQYYKNDIETWMPSRNGFGETHSCSTFHEFQARRLNMKYKTAEGEKKYCHTLNNTCIATPRILIPLLEIHQNKDGSVTIPEVLRPYMNNQDIIKPR
jgi:seryl-tRNA synthetase